MITRKFQLLLISIFLFLICISTIVLAVNVNFIAEKQTNGDVKITIGIPNDAPMAAYYTVIKGNSTETPTEEEYTNANFGIYPGVSTDITIQSNDPRLQGNKLYVWVKAIDDEGNETQICSSQEIAITVENDNNNTSNNDNNSSNINQNISNSNTNTTKEPVTSEKDLPKTGIAGNVLLGITIISIVGFISYIRYKKYNF